MLPEPHSTDGDPAVPKVSLAFLTNGERVLLYLRDDKPDISYPDFWAPLGGHLEGGETPREALEREIEEEIGCRAHDIAYAGRLDVVGQPLCEDHTIFLFIGKIHRPLEAMRLAEGQRLGYFTMDEFRKLKFPGFLRDFILQSL